jgi:putative ABC transport system ATP-binding protein
MIMRECIVRAEKLAKVYNLPAEQISAVRDVDLEVSAGDFISIMGPSGSGKTTLLDSIGCLTTISSGRLTVLGKDVSRAAENTLVSIRREFLGFIFQDFLLIQSLTVLENVLLPLYFARAQQDRSKAIAILQRIGLGHRINHLPAQISGGEKQRVAIARALIKSPKLLLADEPTGNLDSRSSQEIFDLFKQLNEKEGLTIVVVTHNPRLGSQTPRTIYLQDGRIITAASDKPALN